MKNWAVLVGALALASTSSMSLAADVEAANPVFLSGAFEIGAWVNNYNQSDLPETATVFGGYAGGFANARVSDNITFGVDLKGELLPSVASPFFDHTATFETALGANLVYHGDPVNVGIFGAVGKTNSRTDKGDNGVGFMGGGVLGFDVTPDTLLYSQFGYANIRVDKNDSGFTGWFANGGVIHSFSDQFAVRLAGAYGFAPVDYEDPGESGTFWNVGVKGSYAISDVTPIFLTASYDFNRFIANTEDDATEHSFKLGLSFGFGGTQKAKDTFNPYGTPLLPFRAAAYGEVLD
jgi:hypothetical protein